MLNHKEEINKTAYSKTFSSFSGADMVINIGSRVAGDAQSIEWSWNFNQCGDNDAIVGCMSFTLFDREPCPEAYQGKPLVVTITYLNEYGQGMVEEFHGVRFTSAHGGMSVDTIVSEVIYTFTATNREIRPLKKEVQDPYNHYRFMIDFLKDNKNTDVLSAIRIKNTYIEELKNAIMEGKLPVDILLELK